MQGGYASKMRTIIEEDHISDYNYYEQLSVNITDINK